MKYSSQIFMLGLMLLGSVSLTACSSSKVGNEDAPTESLEGVTGDAPAAEASTDAVPAENPVDSLDPSNIPSEGQAAVADASADSTKVSDAPIADAPVADSPISDASIADAPIADAPIADAPVSETAVADATQSGTTNEIAPAPEPVAETGSGNHYQVKKGDTLMKIAFEQYGDLYRWKEIYNSNRSAIKDPNHVPPGTKLSLNGAGMVTIERNGESYLIKKGDTLGLISNGVYGTKRKWKKLWENNRQLIKDPNRIYAGFYLYYVPEGKLTREDIAPGLKKDESAMTAPAVSAAPRDPASTPQVDQNSVPTAEGNKN